MDLHWFARGGGIAKMGPYASQVEAVNALRHIDTGEPIEGAFVWPEIPGRSMREKRKDRK